MYCPNCSKPLIVVERNKIEVEYCIDCNGFFLDEDEWYIIKYELKLPFELTDIMKLPPVTIKEKPKACPKCGEIMEKINLDGLILDRCVRRHGVWFDKGELAEFLVKNKNNENFKTISFLGETLV